MKAMLHDALSRYPASLSACIILALFCAVFTAWMIFVFNPERKPALDRGSRLPLDEET